MYLIETADIIYVNVSLKIYFNHLCQEKNINVYKVKKAITDGVTMWVPHASLNPTGFSIYIEMYRPVSIYYLISSIN